MTEICKSLMPVYSRSRHFRPCTRQADKDGYCFQHHPDEVARRKALKDTQLLALKVQLLAEYRGRHDR